MTDADTPCPDILLVSPPVGNFAQVHPAICLLTAWLRAAGCTVVQRDLAIDCFHHIHSRAYLTDLKARQQAAVETAVRQRPLDRTEAATASAKVRLVLLLDRVARDIEPAKAALRDPDILDHPERLAAALRVLKDVGRAVTAAHPGQHFNFQEFRVDGAFDDWTSIRAALDDPGRNLLLPYVRSLELPAAKCLGLSVTYPDQLLPALAIAERWRALHGPRPVIVGGSFVTRMAESFLDQPAWFDLFDYLVLNDGEEALLALVREGGRPREPRTIPNLCFRDGTTVRKSPLVSRTNLSRLPVPMLDFDGIDLTRYVAPAPVVALPISRGCYWGKCTFCNISNQAEEPYRIRPVDKVVEDIRLLQRTVDTPYFDFCIDSYHPAGLAKLSRALLDAGLSIRWNAEVLLDPKFDAGCLAVMAESGCRHLRFGFETANEGTLEVMRKRNIREVVDRILRDCRSLDIKVSLMSIIGFPTETREQAWHTINYYCDHADDISFVTLHRFNVSAGSPIMHDPSLCGIALERIPGLLQPRHRYTNLNPHGLSPEAVKALMPELEETIRRHFPQHAEIHTVGIGGWLTFLACCRHEAGYFKRSPTAAARRSNAGATASAGAFANFSFDIPMLEAIARGGADHASVGDDPHCVMLSDDGERLIVMSGTFKEHLEGAIPS